MTVLLLVTWIVAGSAPVSYQAAFGSMAACEAARAQLGDELNLMRADYQQQLKLALAFGYAPAPAPQMTAICAPQQ